MSRFLFQVGHEGEEESDIFTIREVSFQPTGESDWKDTNYTLNTDSLDWVSAAATAVGCTGLFSSSCLAPHSLLLGSFSIGFIHIGCAKVHS